MAKEIMGSRLHLLQILSLSRELAQLGTAVASRLGGACCACVSQRDSIGSHNEAGTPGWESLPC
jgi:hypothetical protein